MNMKVFLTGRNLDDISCRLRERGAELVDSADSADLIVAHGGDGALLNAEREYPHRLKYPVRDAETAPLCPEHSLEKQLDALFACRLRLTSLPKLCGIVNDRMLKGVNDIYVHNINHACAMRYNVFIDSELYGAGVVGDGVGVSTVHGSTAYYRSITHSTFRTGIGLAFSNSTELVNHLVLPESSIVRVQILRGPCEMVADNSPERIEMADGDECGISLSGETTPVLALDVFMCPECRRLRHTLRSHDFSMNSHKNH